MIDVLADLALVAHHADHAVGDAGVLRRLALVRPTADLAILAAHGRAGAVSAQVRFLACVLARNDLVRLAAFTVEVKDELGNHLATFHTLRQQHKKSDGKEYFALSDFIAPKSSGKTDYIGAFAVTTGFGTEELAQKYYDDGDDYMIKMSMKIYSFVNSSTNNFTPTTMNSRKIGD